MNPHQMLEETIPEPPPPVLDLDGLIARERRRQRARQAGASMAGVAAVLAILLSAQTFAGPSATRPGSGGPSPGTPTGPAPSEDQAERLVRLSSLFTTRLSAAVAGADFTTSDPTLPALFRVSNGIYRNYDAVEASGQVTGRSRDAELSLLVLHPTATGPPRMDPTLDGILGGCDQLRPRFMPAGPGDPCEKRAGPGGSTITTAQHRRDGLLELDVVVVFPDGGAVAAYAFGEQSSALTVDELIEIVDDRGYVADATPDPSRTALAYLPDDPVVGTEYAFQIWAHCQYDLVPMAGSIWRAQEPYDHHINADTIPGTVRLLDADTAVFTVDQGHAPRDPGVITYQRTGEELPLCG